APGREQQHGRRRGGAARRAGARGPRDPLAGGRVRRAAEGVDAARARRDEGEDRERTEALGRVAGVDGRHPAPPLLRADAAAGDRAAGSRARGRAAQAAAAAPVTHPALRASSHRSEPLPRRPPFLAMEWRAVAVLHWPVPAAALRPLLPPALEVDEFDGTAWIGVVPFLMCGVRLHWLPPCPGAGAFPELNVRTYVRCAGRPGIWFFSLDAGSRLAVRGARALFSLPYLDAHMRCERQDGEVRDRGARAPRGAPPAALRARWRLPARVAPTERGTPAHWFVERYRMYVPERVGGVRSGGVRIGHVAHAPWQLADAAVELERCDMTQLCGL